MLAEGERIGAGVYRSNPFIVGSNLEQPPRFPSAHMFFIVGPFRFFVSSHFFCNVCFAVCNLESQAQKEKSSMGISEEKAVQIDKWSKS